MEFRGRRYIHKSIFIDPERAKLVYGFVDFIEQIIFHLTRTTV